jgi:IS5 family transposase
MIRSRARNGNKADGRCRYKGEAGMKRWVGLGVVADNLLNIGRALEKQSAP